MKHGSNPRRGRARNSGRRHSPSKNTNFESNGPSVKVRGTAQQVQEKYIALARDASSAGDRILAESYLQYAEHYYRVASAVAEQQNQRNAERQQQDGDGEKVDDGESDTSAANDEETSEADEGKENAPRRGRRRQPRARAVEAESTEKSEPESAPAPEPEVASA